MARKTTMPKNPGIDEHSVLRRESSRFQRLEVSHPSVSRGPRAQSTVLPLVLGRGSCSTPDARRSDSRRSARRVSSDGGITAKVLQRGRLKTGTPMSAAHDDRCAQNSLRTARAKSPPPKAKKVDRPGIEPAASVPQVKPKEKAHRSRLTRELKSPTAPPST